MADIKISALTQYKPVTDGMIIPISYNTGGNIYKSGKIVSEDIKEYVLTDLDLTYATLQYVDKAVSDALTGGQEGVDAIFASTSYVTAEDTKLSNRITVLEEIDHTVYALGSDITRLDAKVDAETERATVAEADILSQAKSYTVSEIAKIDFTPYATTISLGEVEDKVDANTEAIELLNSDSSVSGSVANTVATEIAKVVADADEDFDTLKEIADWIANDATGAAAMSNAIATNKTNLEAEVQRATAAESKALEDANKYTDEAVKDKVDAQYVSDAIAAIPATDLTAYATKTYVSDAIAAIPPVDLTSYAKTTEIQSWVNDQNFATSSYATSLGVKIDNIDTEYKNADTTLSNRIKAIEDASILHATIEQLNTHTGDGAIHVTTEYKTKWNASATQTALDAALSRISVLEAKLAQYDARFGWNENVATDATAWTVSFLQID